MARVYLARDLRHERQVALKVLRPEIASAVGADRFLAEIRTTANLQHPHLLPLFDSGRVTGASTNDPGLLYYVMPFVEGESLRQRLAREKQLPVAHAIRLAVEVADALDYAHRRGILHRDIKPENILLHDGHALVADFGIALALTRAAGAARLTATGLSIGTPQYMSPEQAAGEPDLDARTDVYALGATLYEMLTGEPPHSGATPQIVMARAATERPRPIREVRATVSPQVEAAVMTALQRLPADRFASAAEMARVLRAESDRSADWNGTTRSTVQWRHVLVTAGLAVVVTALATRAWMWRRVDDDTPRVTARLMLPLPPEHVLQPTVTPFAISPDGARIVYAASVGETARLYLRPMDVSEVRAIPSTEGAQGPFFSPDGQWIGYHAAGKLWKVAVAGGAPIALADALSFCGASWGAAEAILFSQCDGALHRFSSRGGDEEKIVVRIDSRAPDSAGPIAPAAPLVVQWPAILPDGRHALVAVQQRIGVVDLATGILRPLVDGNQAVYLPTGHLLFDAGEGRMRVARFSLSRLELIGEPVPAFETFRGPGGGSSFFSVSESGTLVHVTGGFSRWLVLTDRSGRPEGAAPEARGYRFPRFSPDGRRIAVTVDPRPSNIWIVDLPDWRATPVTTDGGIVPVWSADGKRIGFTTRGDTWSVTGPGDEPQPLNRVPADAPVYLSSWAPDGSLFAYRAARTGYDLAVLAPSDSAWRTFLATPAMERDPTLSPDGRWIAYVSDRSGNAEVYVRPREGNSVGVMASAGGGREPRWAGGGREIVFRRGSSMMTVAVQTGTTFQALGTPRELFAVGYDFSQDNNWDVTADGQHFVFVRNDAATPGGLIVVLNWFETVRGERDGTARRP
jgi:serine/threonine-protein kinase